MPVLAALVLFISLYTPVGAKDDDSSPALSPIPPISSGFKPFHPLVAREQAPVSGFSSKAQGLIQEMRSRWDGGQKVDPLAYFGQLLQLEPRRFQDMINLIMGMASFAQASSPNLKSDLWLEYVKHNQNNPAGYAGLASAQAEQGDHGAAVASYTKAIDLGGGTAQNYYGRGFSTEQLGDHELAHQDAQKALALEPGNQAAYALYKLTDGRLSRMRVDPGTGRASTVLGPVAAAQNPSAQEDPASLVVPRAAQTGPGADSAKLSTDMTLVAQRFLQLNDARSALAAAAKAVAFDPRNAQAYNLLATADARAGRYEDAVADANKALDLAPRSVPALNTRSWALSNMGKFSDSLQDASHALEIEPNNGYAFLNKARAQGGLGQRDQMLDSLRRAAALDPRLRGIYESATHLPQDKDTELLFSGTFDENRGSDAASAGRIGLLTAWMLSLLGAGLLVFGLAQIFSSSSRRERFSATLRRLRPRRPQNASPKIQGDLEQYELRRVIATGGMGVVYEALDKALNRKVALKKMRGEIRDDKEERERFLKEARTVATLQHPHIVQIHSILESGRDIYLVFEFIEGQTLKEAMIKEGRLPLVEAVDILSGVCSALDYAHARGVIHRDLKPSNIMVDAERMARVMDFGVARQAKDALVRAAMTNTVMGTPPYMAPESEQGVIRKEADIYSLGVCLYEVLTGGLPFKGSPGAMFENKRAGKFDPPSRLAKVPRGLDAIVARALAPDPEDRFVCAKDILNELKALV